MLIAVDFDGTIVEHAYPKIGRPIPFAIDVLAGCAFGFIGTDENPDILTIGPALSAALRITPAGFSAVALDAGAAVYGQFGIGDEYTGVNFVPYVSITFDISSWPVLFHPYHSSHVIIF